MTSPVWVLSVDLQTKTAAFSTGMADAAKSARGAFTDIKDGAKGAGRETGVSMMEARHGVMLLGEEFGIRLPRAISSFIASIGPIGAAMQAAFPFLAIIALAGILIEHLKKLKEEGIKLAENEEKFITTTSNTFNNLRDKMLEAGIKADELDKDHLSALKKQLELIDRASLKDLVSSFEEVAKAADAVMGPLASHWYEFGHGSRGAQHALNEFKLEYEKLMAQGKSGDASNLLSGTLTQAEYILSVLETTQKAAAAIEGKSGTMGDEQRTFELGRVELKKYGLGYSEKELKAQEALVDTLRAQAGFETQIANLKKLQESNAKRTTGNEVSGDEDAAFKRQTEAENKELEIAENLRQEAYATALQQLQQSERAKIEATEQGSGARLQAIDAALKEEDAKGLQETAFYQQLLTSKVQIARQMSEDQRRATTEAATEEAGHSLRMAELKVASEQQQQQLMNSMRRVSIQARLHQELQLANSEYVVKMTAYSREIAALDKHGKDYENKLKQIQNKQSELTKQHENQVTAIKVRAEMERNQRILSAERQMQDTVSAGLAGVLMRHQTFGQMMASLGDQVVTGMLQNAIKMMMTLDMTKGKEASAAARKAFLAGWHFPFPANIVMAPVLGAMAFASVMAFNKGGIVPGSGNVDSVPAVLTPGEHVADQELTEGLRGMVRDRSAQPGHTYKINAPYSPRIQALDASGVDHVLAKHEAAFQKKFEQVLRKMNK